MAFFTRLSNGWEAAKVSFKVLNAQKELIIFPILSGLSFALVIASFFTGLLANVGWNIHNIDLPDGSARYLLIFAFYIVTYFISVFFNMALMHCVRLYLHGEQVSIGKGIRFSLSRIVAIFSWAIFAATVGVLLKLLQDNLGWLGKLFIGIVGFVWSAATFFAVPVIAYENRTPYEALKRSAGIMKERWGESIGANFSIGLLTVFPFIVIVIIGMGISEAVNEQAGIWIFVIGGLAMIIIANTLRSIFISVLYDHLTKPGDHIDQQMIDNLFVEK